MENSYPKNTTSIASSSSSASSSAPSPLVPTVNDVESLHRHIQQRLANIWRECEADNIFQLIAPPSAVDKFIWPPFDLHMKSLLYQQLRSSSSTSSSMSVSSTSSHKRKRGVDQGEFTSHAIVKLAHGWKAWSEHVREGKGTIRNITSHSQGGETNEALPSDERMDTDTPSVSSSPSPSASSSVSFDLPAALSSWAQLLVDRFNRSIKTSTPDSYIFDGVTVHHERGYINFFVEPKRLATLINNQLSAQLSSSAISSSTVSAVSSSTLPPSFAPSPSPMAASATSPHLGHSSLFSFDSIGFLRSVYKEKHGTPRQGCVVHGARSSLTLHGSISSQALDGLDEFDHVWLMFVFHHNGPNPIASAKVTPPRANGQRAGIFATRTPHRPNPIGLSLARLDRIEGSIVYLSGLDLIEGTPVIDIKPYHPADCIPHGLYITPPWVKSIEHTSLQVEWTARAIDQLHTFMDQSSSSPLASSSLPSANKFGLEFYSSNEFSLVHSTLTSLIAQDPRTLHSKARHSNGIYGIQFDRLDVCFAIKEEKQASDCTGEGQSEDEPSTNTPTLSPSLMSSFSPSSSLPSALIFHLVYHPPTTGRENVRPRLRTVEWLETIREKIQAIEEWRNGKQA